jgi:hypothetical protein
MNFVQFCTQRGLTTDYDVESHIHAGLRSAPTTKTYKRWFEKRLNDLQGARDYAKAEYAKAIASGEIVVANETRRERLMRLAEGHPDNESVQAARRLLAKMQARQEAQISPT